jgi:hypothetical protein
LLAAVLSVSAGVVLAQAPAPAKDAKETKEAKEAREAAEAMERARRLAANPLRLIQEASRVRRRSDGEPAVAPVAAPAAAAPVAAAAASPEPVARAAVPPTRDAAAPEAPVAVMNSDLVQARTPPEAAPPLDAQALPRPLQPANVSLPALAPLLPGLSRPTLVSRVDPELPPRVLVELEPNTAVLADLTIRPDGSVSEVAIASPNGRPLARYIVPALQQWRFEPLPSQRQWRVELLFRAE